MSADSPHFTGVVLITVPAIAFGAPILMPLGFFLSILGLGLLSA